MHIGKVMGVMGRYRCMEDKLKVSVKNIFKLHVNNRVLTKYILIDRYRQL